MIELANHYEFRDALAEAIIRDLVGPRGSEEPRPDEKILNEAPMNRYISGVLYPPTPDRVDEIEDNEIESIDQVDRDDQVDPPIAMANIRYPSAMGLTCCVDTAVAKAVRVTVNAARYLPIEGAEQVPERWERRPLRLTYDIDLRSQRHDQRPPIGHGLQLFVRERDPSAAGMSTITVALINTLAMPADEWRRDQYSFFQVEFEISAQGAGAFVDRTGNDSSGVDDDARSFALLYRHSPTFAAGHGCGAEWDIGPGGNQGKRAERVRTAVTPSHELLLADNNPEISSPYFSMRKLATDERVDVIEGLRAFVSGYSNWINAQTSMV